MPAYPIRSALPRAVLALALFASGAAASAGTIHIAINTTAFGPATGYLEMQLSAGAGVPLATALVTNLSGFDPLRVTEQWGVGNAAGGYLFRNDAVNSLLHGVDFGGVLSFDLTFTGTADPLDSYISRFVVSAFDTNYALLGMRDALTGALVEISHAAPPMPGTDGTIGVRVWDQGVAVTPAAEPGQVPEPASVLLVAAGLAAMTLARQCRSTLRS
jgi:hypothetical protein